jgi:hypothetical protein
MLLIDLFAIGFEWLAHAVDSASSKSAVTAVTILII